MSSKLQKSKQEELAVIAEPDPRAHYVIEILFDQGNTSAEELADVLCNDLYCMPSSRRLIHQAVNILKTLPPENLELKFESVKKHAKGADIKLLELAVNILGIHQAFCIATVLKNKNQPEIDRYVLLKEIHDSITYNRLPKDITNPNHFENIDAPGGKEANSSISLLAKRQQLKASWAEVAEPRAINPFTDADFFTHEPLPKLGAEFNRAVSKFSSLKSQDFAQRLPKMREALGQQIPFAERGDLFDFLDHVESEKGPRLAFVTGALLRNPELREDEKTYNFALSQAEQTLLSLDKSRDSEMSKL